MNVRQFFAQPEAVHLNETKQLLFRNSKTLAAVPNCRALARTQIGLTAQTLNDYLVETAPLTYKSHKNPKTAKNKASRAHFMLTPVCFKVLFSAKCT